MEKFLIMSTKVSAANASKCVCKLERVNDFGISVKRKIVNREHNFPFLQCLICVKIYFYLSKQSITHIHSKLFNFEEY